VFEAGAPAPVPPPPRRAVRARPADHEARHPRTGRKPRL